MLDKSFFSCPTTWHISLIKHELLKLQDSLPKWSTLPISYFSKAIAPSSFKMKQEFDTANSLRKSRFSFILRFSQCHTNQNPVKRKPDLIKITKPKYLIHYNHCTLSVLQSYLINTTVILFKGTTGCWVTPKEKEGSCQAGHIPLAIWLYLQLTIL